MDINSLWIILFSIPGVIIATVAHEWSRAILSSTLGDVLPKEQKRLSLNPLRHLEPIGCILMLVTGGFGWGRPVETSALYYKNRKRDTLLVAILPTVVNLVLALLFMVLYKVIGNNAGPKVSIMLTYCIRYNAGIAVFNLVPVPPMDCVKVLSVVMPANKYFQYMQYEKVIQMGFLILLFMGFFSRIFEGIINMVIQILNVILFFI